MKPEKPNTGNMVQGIIGLQKQLVEKDKEIKELKRQLGDSRQAGIEDCIEKDKEIKELEADYKWTSELCKARSVVIAEKDKEIEQMLVSLCLSIEQT